MGFSFGDIVSQPCDIEAETPNFNASMEESSSEASSGVFADISIANSENLNNIETGKGPFKSTDRDIGVGDREDITDGDDALAIKNFNAKSLDMGGGDDEVVIEKMLTKKVLTLVMAMTEFK